MARNPAFQFYAQDFLLGTAHLNAEEVGGYIRLLCHQWDKGFIPDSEEKLRKLTGIKKRDLHAILEKFKKHDDGLKNSRLEEVREIKAQYILQAIENGKKGGRPRKPDPNRTLTEPEPNLNRKITSSSPSSSSTTTTNVVVDNDKVFFEMFRRASGDHIGDAELLLELARFKNRYPNIHANQAGALVNTWVANIGKKENKVEKATNWFV